MTVEIDVERLCGHHERVRISGRLGERARLIQLERTRQARCSACYTDDAEAVRRALLAEVAAMVRRIGAKAHRDRASAALFVDAFRQLRQIDGAAWWIDHRAWSTRALLEEQYDILTRKAVTAAG